MGAAGAVAGRCRSTLLLASASASKGGRAVGAVRGEAGASGAGARAVDVKEYEGYSRLGVYMHCAAVQRQMAAAHVLDGVDAGAAHADDQAHQRVGHLVGDVHQLIGRVHAQQEGFVVVAAGHGRGAVCNQRVVAGRGKCGSHGGGG